MLAKSRKRIDWGDEAPTVSVNEVRRLLHIDWRSAARLMETGRIPSQNFGLKGQKYYRTSYKTLRLFLDGKLPAKGGRS